MLLTTACTAGTSKLENNESFERAPDLIVGINAYYDGYQLTMNGEDNKCDRVRNKYIIARKGHPNWLTHPRGKHPNYDALVETSLTAFVQGIKARVLYTCEGVPGSKTAYVQQIYLGKF